MPGSSEPYNLRLFSAGCLSSEGAFEPDIPKEEGIYVQSSCENSLGSRIITCRHPFRDEFVDEVGGLSYDKRLEPVLATLPAYIPVLDDNLRSLSHASIPSPVVGLTLVDVLRTGVSYSHGSWREQPNISFKLDLLIHQAIREKDVILFPSGQDTMIEWLWHERENCHLFEQLGMMGFSMISGINFSVIKGECAFAQRLNQKKSLESAYLAQRAGIPAIPHVYALNEFHIEAWVQYFLNNPQVTMFCMNCQLQRSAEDRETVISSVLTILRRVPWELHVILLGFPIAHIRRFGVFLSRIHFADKVAVKCAHSHKRVTTNLDTGKTEAHYSSDPATALTTYNINQRRIYIEMVKRDVLRGYAVPDEFKEIFKKHAIREPRR